MSDDVKISVEILLAKIGQLVIQLDYAKGKLEEAAKEIAELRKQLPENK